MVSVCDEATYEQFTLWVAMVVWVCDEATYEQYTLWVLMVVWVCDEATYEQFTLWVAMVVWVCDEATYEQYTLWVVMVVWVCEEVTYEQFTLWVVMVVLVLLWRHCTTRLTLSSSLPDEPDTPDVLIWWQSRNRRKKMKPSWKPWMCSLSGISLSPCSSTITMLCEDFYDAMMKQRGLIFVLPDLGILPSTHYFCFHTHLTSTRRFG